MSDYCVVVADGARARLFSLQDSTVGAGGPDLVELSDLTNPDVAAEALRGDEKRGHNVASPSSGSHGYEDHRDRHRQESERRFAKQIMAEVTQTLGREHAGSLVLAAEAQMLSHLREALNLPAYVRVREVQKDLVKFSPHELHAHLATDGALPGRKIPA